MAKHYELVVFTASLSKYAEPLVDRLDPKGYCYFRLFREHCTMVNGAFVKDLKRLDRDLKDVIILDNSPISYALNIENGFPIKSWYEDKSDKELYNITPILEHLAYVTDVRDYIKKITERNEISYSKVSAVINIIQKKERENNFLLKQNNIENNNNENFTDNFNSYNKNSVGKSNVASERTTPKYSSNIFNKKEEIINNIKLINNNFAHNNLTPHNLQNEKKMNENLDNKGNISIKFINNNINNYIINNQDDYNNPNPKLFSYNNFIKEKEKPEKKNKKINAFRNVANPQKSTNFYNADKDNNIPNNLNISDKNDLFLNKPSKSPNTNNIDNILVNSSTPLQHGIFSKFPVKQFNLSNEYNSLNRLSREDINLNSSKITKNINVSSSLNYKTNLEAQISRPGTSLNLKGKNHSRDKSNNSYKELYNNKNLIATIKRTPSTISLTKTFSNNYNKQSGSIERKQKSIDNILRLTPTNIPKNYSSKFDIMKNGEFLRNSLNNVNIIGINKSKTGNNLNIKAPTINSMIDNEFIKRGYSLSSRGINYQIKYKPLTGSEYQQNSYTPNNKYTPSPIIRSSSFRKNERY